MGRSNNHKWLFHRPYNFQSSGGLFGLLKKGREKQPVLIRHRSGLLIIIYSFCKMFPIL